jgi:two-component system chemotaxis response regulator CheB
MKVDPGRREAVVIGGSRGAFEALSEILPCLPEGFPLPVALVLHQYRHTTGYLVDALASRAKLPVVGVEDKAPITPGKIHVCPPNYHLLVEPDGVFSLSTDPPVLSSRPAIDVLFESAAAVWGPRLVGVLLSGASVDGANGLRAIKRRGGFAICQDPAHAVDATMPRAGCEAAGADCVEAPGAIGVVLSRLRP